MKYVLVLLLALTTTTLSFGQQEEEIFEPVQVPPNYKGGMTAFFKYVHNNLEYPPTAAREGVEGKVFVQFVVDSTGAIIDDSVKVFQSLHPQLDKEAVRLLQESPDWIPGRITPNGTPAKVRMVLPIQFEIDKKTKRKIRKEAKEKIQ